MSTKMMRAITNTGPSQLEWTERPIPEPGPGQVRVRVKTCGICHTDLKMIAGWPRTTYPSIPGHEWSGVVDALGEEVDPAWLGAPVVAENVLADGGEVGFEHPGGYGQYLLTEARCLYRLPQGFPWSRAALIEPLAVCVHALRRLAAPPGSPVLLFGDGPVGLLALMLMRHYGLGPVSLVGGTPRRLALALKLGASEVYDYHAAGEEDLTLAVRAEFSDLFDYVLEASGSPLAAEAALRMARPGGRILILGDYDDARLDFPWNFILHQELEIFGSNASAGAWPEALRIAAEGAVDLDRLITHRITISNYARGIELVRKRDDGAVKVVMEWPD